MKILLAAINAKYIHSNPAVYSLKAYADKSLKQTDHQQALTIELAEYTINQPRQKVMADICKKKPAALFFSCYIWNISMVEELAQDIGKVMPQTDIWFGGPEVSFDAEETLQKLSAVKGVMRGEGEETFSRILRYYRSQGISLEDINGITFRTSDGKIVRMPEAAPLQIDSVPFPYTDLKALEDRIVYYESSRGCPFRCSYCLSSVDKSLRFRDMDRVKEEISFFMKQGVPQVKFIDRTFNCDGQRAREIWQFIRDNDNGITNFHFEIAGDLLTDEDVAVLRRIRAGQIQLEIGIQTTNGDTLRAIDRSMDFDKLSEAVRQIRAVGNIHIHLDLIAGLPFEDMASFRKSFDDVFALRPHQLQLGFLKVLKGSPMEKNSPAYGLKYTQSPPYEVLETRWMLYDEFMKLKQIEEMVEVYYNTGQFSHSLELLLQSFDSAFDLFAALAEWYENHGFDMLNLSRNSRYEILLAFGGECLKEAMILDYYLRENVKTRPAFLGEETVDRDFVKMFYSLEAREHRFLNGDVLARVEDPRVLRKHTHLERTHDRYLLFDYTRREPLTNNAMMIEI